MAEAKQQTMNSAFRKLAQTVSVLVATPAAFLLAFFLLLVWATLSFIVGPPAGWLPSRYRWQSV
jgi:hypothetical protein